MNRLWEQNKALVVVMGVCLLVLVVVRPTIFGSGPPLARWMGKDWKKSYDALVTKNTDLDAQLKGFHPDAGGEAISAIQTKIELSNARLKQNFDEYVHALAFVPYRPYLPPPKLEWGPYFRQVLTATRTDLLQYCSFRFVDVAEELGFGEFEKTGEVPRDDVVQQLLRELAVIETFVKRCADCQIKSTEILHRFPRKDASTPTRHLFWEYPMQVKVRCGYRELMKLVQSLNGCRGLVKDVEVNEFRDVLEKVTLNIGRTQGVRKDDSFTIFQRTPDKPCELRYAGRVTVISVSDTESVAKVEEDQLPYDRFDGAHKETGRIQRGDAASNGFFRITQIEIKAVPGTVDAIDTDGVPSRVVPHSLEVVLDLTTIGFDPATEYVTAKNVKGGAATTKKPPRTTPVTTTGSGGPVGPPARRSF